MTPHVFISYSHVNKSIAKRLSKRLDKIGVKHFLDEKAINWGASITPTVRKALDDCFAIVVVISHASLKSAWVPFEVGHAMGANFMGANKRVLPLLTDPTLSLPGYLADLSYVTDIRDVVKYFGSKDWKDHVLACQAARSQDIRRLRREITQLNTWLNTYMPSAREPEEL
jgi:hypothetical protein